LFKQKLLGYQITIKITLPRLVQIAKFQFTLATCTFTYTSQAKQFQLQYHDLVSVIKHILYDEMLSFLLEKISWLNKLIISLEQEDGSLVHNLENSYSHLLLCHTKIHKRTDLT
jgi:hypothetical protein